MELPQIEMGKVAGGADLSERGYQVSNLGHKFEIQEIRVRQSKEDIDAEYTSLEC